MLGYGRGRWAVSPDTTTDPFGFGSTTLNWKFCMHYATVWLVETKKPMCFALTDEIRQDMEDVIARMKPWYVKSYKMFVSLSLFFFIQHKTSQAC